MRTFPGKTYLLGEYAVLDPLGCALMTTVKRSLMVQVRDMDHFSLVSDHLLVPLEAQSMEALITQCEALPEVQSALMIAHEQWPELLPTEFSIISDLEDHGEKYGLGSSGAVVAGMLDAVARQCNQALTDADLFRMSVLAQQISRHTGSGGDLAATIYGGTIYYRRFTHDWPQEGTGPVIRRLNERSWMHPILVYTGMPNPHDLRSTRDFQKQFPQHWQLFVQRASDLVHQAEMALIEDDFQGWVACIRAYRVLLQELQAASGVVIETEAIRQFLDLCQAQGWTGKTTGAGGGDCLVVWTTDKSRLAQLCEASGFRILEEESHV